jgi:hypothetical protein
MTRVTFGRLVALLAVIAGVLSIATLVRTSASMAPPKVVASVADARWWQTSFPPRAASLAVREEKVHFRRDRVLADVICGALDDAVAEEDGGVTFFGWAWDPRTKKPADGVLLRDNGRDVPRVISVFRDRGDIAAPMGDRSLLKIGFFFWLPRESVSPGAHTYEAWALLGDGRLCRLERTRHVTIPAARNR